MGWLMFSGLKDPSLQGAKGWFSNDLIEIFKPYTYLRPYLFPVQSDPNGPICPNMESQLAAPASEVVEIISEWFTSQGHAVRRDFPRPGTVHLTAWSTEDEWDITIRPQSALASVATVIHQGDINAIQACRRLQEYLDGYLLGTSPNLPLREHRRRQFVPPAALDRIETVVCIRARSRGRDVQFTGFVVNPGGLVLCTAHDLTHHQQVTVTFYDAVAYRGPSPVWILTGTWRWSSVRQASGRPYLFLRVGTCWEWANAYFPLDAPTTCRVPCRPASSTDRPGW